MSSSPQKVLTLSQQLEASASWLKEQGCPKLSVVLVLGSGQSAITQDWPVETLGNWPYADIPYMASSKVQGHSGEFRVLRFANANPATPELTIGVFSGRTHAYETLDLNQVVFPIRLAKFLGAQSIWLTNAAGGLAPGLKPGSLMVLSDHLNFTGLHPLRANPDPTLGAQFYDMSEAYCHRLKALAFKVAQTQQLELHEGVYAWMLGPSYETPAEIRMLGMLGASAVGMSTVPEVLAARHVGLSVFALSCITNMAAGLENKTLNHQEVLDTAKQVHAHIANLLLGMLLQWQE